MGELCNQQWGGSGCGLVVFSTLVDGIAASFSAALLGHSSIATTLDIYSHTVPGLQKAAAERFDTLLPVQEQKENVGKMSAEGGENECRPYRSRTCDTLIKSHGVLV